MIKPEELGKLSVEEAAGRLYNRNFRMMPSQDSIERVQTVLTEIGKNDAHIDDVTTMLLAQHGFGKPLAEDLKKLSSLKKMSPESVFWGRGDVHMLSRAANYDLFKAVSDAVKSRGVAGNVELYSELKKDLSVDERFRRMSKKKGQEAIAATTRALARAGLLEESSSRAGRGPGGISRRYSWPGARSGAVETWGNPVLYALDAMHKKGNWMPVAELHKPLSNGRKAIGDPHAVFDQHAMSKALGKAKSHGLIESKSEVVNVLDGNLRFKRTSVRLTPQGRGAWVSHLQKPHPLVIKASQIRRRMK